MKIDDKQLQALQALQQQGEAHRKNKAADGFEALISEKLGTEQTNAQAAQGMAGQNAAALSGPLSLLLNSSEAMAGTEATDSDLDMAALTVGNLLDQWESYADKLAESGQKQDADLRSVYNLLDGMGKDLTSLRAAVPDLAARSGNLESLVNELEVMTTTEKFKFNRGDYL